MTRPSAVTGPWPETNSIEPMTMALAKLPTGAGARSGRTRPIRPSRSSGDIDPASRWVAIVITQILQYVDRRHRAVDRDRPRAVWFRRTFRWRSGNGCETRSPMADARDSGCRRAGFHAGAARPDWAPGPPRAGRAYRGAPARHRWSGRRRARRRAPDTAPPPRRRDIRRRSDRAR